MRTKRSEFFAALRDSLPILMGVMPFGLIYGASARSAGIPAVITQSMSFIVFAGSAQFIIVQLITASVPAGIIILIAAIVNLRHALYSASLAPYLKHLRSAWQVLLAYLLTDEVYAIVITHYQQREESHYKHWYFLGAGLALWSTWQVSTAVGIVLGARVDPSWSLDFALPLTFIAIVVPTLKHRADVIAAITAGIIAVLAVHLPLNSGLLVATCIGIVAGVSIEAKSKQRYMTGKDEQEVQSIDPASSDPVPSETILTEHSQEEDR